MRMDKICDRLYGNTNLEEEIMKLNNILNQWTINVGDEIKYLVDDFGKMHEVDATVSLDSTRTSLINTNKKTKKVLPIYHSNNHNYSYLVYNKRPY